jgi:hypothetical protein
MVIRALAIGNNIYALKSLGACRSVNKAKQTESIFFSGCRSGPLPGNVHIDARELFNISWICLLFIPSFSLLTLFMQFFRLFPENLKFQLQHGPRSHTN